MARECAYCGCNGRLTREHIWPKGIIDRVNYKTRFTGQGKVISGELTIADVCATCNNGPLADLDAYICELYDRYFFQFHDRGSEVEFEYDWTKLGNWFLKASFNAARAAKNERDTKILSQFTQLIRGIDRRQPDLAIWADLTEPSYVASQAESGIFTAKQILPAMVRFMRIQIPDTQLSRYTLRVIAINSFYFYIAIPVEPYMPIAWDELERIGEFYALMTVLDPEEAVATIKTTGMGVDGIVAPHFIHNDAAYRTFHEQNKNA